VLPGWRVVSHGEHVTEVDNENGRRCVTAVHDTGHYLTVCSMGAPAVGEFIVHSSHRRFTVQCSGATAHMVRAREHDVVEPEYRFTQPPVCGALNVTVGSVSYDYGFAAYAIAMLVEVP